MVVRRLIRWDLSVKRKIYGDRFVDWGLSVLRRMLGDRFADWIAEIESSSETDKAV